MVLFICDVWFTDCKGTSYRTRVVPLLHSTSLSDEPKEFQPPLTPLITDRKKLSQCLIMCFCNSPILLHIWSADSPLWMAWNILVIFMCSATENLLNCCSMLSSLDMPIRNSDCILVIRCTQAFLSNILTSYRNSPRGPKVLG
jgi:hypothetical protein